MSQETSTCPGCGVTLHVTGAKYDRKFHASAECWAVYEQVLAREYQNPALFGQVHQLTVDAYSVQHAGGNHPDKSVCIHLVGLYLVLERGFPQNKVPPILQRLASRTDWLHIDPPAARAAITVLDVFRADAPPAHAATVRNWAEAVWQAWTPHHGIAREMVGDVIGPKTR